MIASLQPYDDLHARVAALWAERDSAFEALRAANERGVTGADVDAFTAAGKVFLAGMADLITPLRRKGITILFANSDGSVSAWYAASNRFRVIA